ncbi:hypothetical protein [Paucidesulfovibrio longus]|uniref:hypothetical protein n=1 Tax=Paucidesulfovibrio longus TaxID=889 RepID=UPI0003B4FFD1|nr:hypothetical protein [Paucidesulfovibrio longus]
MAAQAAKRSAARAVLGLAALLALLAAAGCGMVPTWAGGDPGPVKVEADGEQAFAETVGLGEPLVLDMRDPGLSGYEFAGTAFDPAMFRLDSVLEDGFRARYVFMPLAAGESTIVVRIQAKGGGPLETYKRVKVTVED